mgnify:CR=1 FL=1
MAERIVSPGVFTNEKDLSFLPAGIAAIGAVIIGTTSNKRNTKCFLSEFFEMLKANNKLEGFKVSECQDYKKEEA